MKAKKTAKKKPGLYANIHAKQERIEEGSGETMRKKGEEGAPKKGAFRTAAKTATKKRARSRRRHREEAQGTLLVHCLATARP